MSSSLFASQVWSVALKQDSTLLTPATLAKLPAEEAASVSELCSLLLLQHAHYLDPPTAATVARLMLAVLLHYAAPVRRAGVKAVAHCVAEKPQLAGVNATMSCLPSLAAWFKCIEKHPVTLLCLCRPGTCCFWGLGRMKSVTTCLVHEALICIPELCTSL